MNAGIGKGGKSFQDRALASKVRSTAIIEMQKVLDGKAEIKKWSRFKKDLLLRMATTVLPRLNEHTGEDGGAIVLEMNAITFKKFKNEGKRGSASK